MSFNEIIDKWGQQGVSILMEEKENIIILNSIIIPSEKRKMGIGGQIIKELIEYADNNRKKIELSKNIRESIRTQFLGE
jgi:predicted GNAT family acetyltransferase